MKSICFLPSLWHVALVLPMNMHAVFFGFIDEDFRKALRHAKAGIFMYSAKSPMGENRLAPDGPAYSQLHKGAFL